MKEQKVIPAKVREEILVRLQRAEQEHNVRVLYAVESGSRAWGFASENSDYDVRFVYAHHTDWYLSVDVEEKRDVIEYPIVDEIDINGWDIRKALKLLRKSNPSIIEWFHSPIVYLDREGFSQATRELLPIYASKTRNIYHYRHMAKGNFREYLKKEKVPLKKYFYVLRPLLTIRWIEKYGVPAPIEFDVLMDVINDHDELQSTIYELVERKKASKEKEYICAIPILNDFIEKEFRRLENIVCEEKIVTPPFTELNAVFQKIVQK